MDKAINIAKEIISEVNKKVKRVYWTNEEIDKYFGRRSVEEILSSGETCFMNPCLDLTLVSSHLISKKKIPHKLVIEEHLPSNGFDFNRLHFVIEFQNNDKQSKEYFLNYKRANEVYLLEGKYNGRQDLPLAQILKIQGLKLNPKKPLYVNLGYKTLEEFSKENFKGYSLEKNISRLKKDNSIENYQKYKQKFGEDFLIITRP
ncbi:MAG TPA: hypothetical protein PKW70_00970 [Candidatus Pacearchaeota archaeon]|nr:hypothetical protein [Candidatus Pacearchaeota archaeon]HPJ86651.1 hypothetical protein [Candidatus Pacearchaeota archaeon]